MTFKLRPCYFYILHYDPNKVTVIYKPYKVKNHVLFRYAPMRRTICICRLFSMSCSQSSIVLYTHSIFTFSVTLVLPQERELKICCKQIWLFFVDVSYTVIWLNPQYLFASWFLSVKILRASKNFQLSMKCIHSSFFQLWTMSGVIPVNPWYNLELFYACSSTYET